MLSLVSLSRRFQIIYAFADGKVLFGAVLFDDEEAPCFVKIRVNSNLEFVEVLEFRVVSVVMSYDLLHESLVSLIKFFAVSPDVQNSSRFRFNFVDVHVMDASDSERDLLLFGFFFSLQFVHFLLVLSRVS